MFLPRIYLALACPMAYTFLEESYPQKATPFISQREATSDPRKLGEV